jgi:chaperonin GroES
MDVKDGDRALLGKYPGHRGENRRDEYLIMKESDIMGVVVEAKAHKKAA